MLTNPWSAKAPPEQKLHLKWLVNCKQLADSMRKLQDNIKLQVLQQNLATTSVIDTIGIINLPIKALIRKVQITFNSKILATATVIAPKTTYYAYQHILDNLGDNFIGESLLYPNKWQRSEFEFSQQHNMWHRRSLFIDQNNYKLIIIENILPSIQALYDNLSQ